MWTDVDGQCAFGEIESGFNFSLEAELGDTRNNDLDDEMAHLRYVKGSRII